MKMAGRYHLRSGARTADYVTRDEAVNDDLLRTQPQPALELHDNAGRFRRSNLADRAPAASGSQNAPEDCCYTQEPVMDVGSAANETASAAVNRHLERRLYTSHLLSTWNSRLFEFGAVLFLASIFPGTLLPMSVYALVRSGAAILFAQSIGSWINRGNRLAVVRTSIIGQRLAVAASCGIFWALERQVGGTDRRVTNGLFSLVAILACVEKLCSMMNLIALERDWVVVITEGNESARRGTI